MNIEELASNYAESVCNGKFPIEYTREQVVKHTKNDFMEGAGKVLKELQLESIPDPKKWVEENNSFQHLSQCRLQSLGISQ